jgi:hypothetical protein
MIPWVFCLCFGFSESLLLQMYEVQARKRRCFVDENLCQMCHDVKSRSVSRWQTGIQNRTMNSVQFSKCDFFCVNCLCVCNEGNFSGGCGAEPLLRWIFTTSALPTSQAERESNTKQSMHRSRGSQSWLQHGHRAVDDRGRRQQEHTDCACGRAGAHIRDRAHRPASTRRHTVERWRHNAVHHSVR